MNSPQTNQPKPKMDNTHHVACNETLLLVAAKYFQRISPVQWSMIGAQTWDSDTQANVADMCTEIVQRLATNILKSVAPMFEDKKASKADITTAVDKFTRLKDSLIGSFAEAFHVPQDKCDSAIRLAEVVEREVAKKVHSVVSVAINRSVWPSEPAVFVGGCISNTSLQDMVSHAAKCLDVCYELCGLPKSTKFVSQIISEITEPILTEPTKCESSQSVISVRDILVKWSNDTPESRENADSAASEIVRSIMQSGKRPHFATRSICNILRKFFTTQSAPSKDKASDNQKVRKKGFMNFAQRQFEKLKAQLKCASTADFLVSLTSDSLSSQDNLEDSDFEVLLPGSIPESPTPRFEPTRLTSKPKLISVIKQSSSGFDFDSIKTDVDSLFDQLHLQENPATNGRKTPDVIMSTNEMRKFSKELIDKFYDHLTAGPTYQIPMVQTGTILSNSVISEYRREADATEPHLSPEVRYVMIEDAVRKFLQQVVYWLQKEPSKTIDSDKVSGALTDLQKLFIPPTPPRDIQNLTTTQLTPLPDVRKLTMTQSSPLRDTRKLTSTQLTPTPDKKDIIKQESPEVTDNRTATPSQSRSTAAMKNILITALLLRILKKVPQENGRVKGQGNFKDVIKRLLEEAQDEINIPEGAVRKTTKKLAKLIKAVSKDLEKEFGSPEKLLEAAAASDACSLAVCELRRWRAHRPQ
ncbi:uncharacterized protein tespa1 isoform X1 [Sebastes umbrosus]|uniref:uncharacterized protein tespa1 isoform X1 n=1 Tax=Sebastes umbrosus TaxID=72105 RepID=UPI0018A08D8C|nr:uncharacterized protein tespa1 isoform X1 [Sebastes umbrosus]